MRFHSFHESVNREVCAAEHEAAGSSVYLLVSARLAGHELKEFSNSNRRAEGTCCNWRCPHTQDLAAHVNYVDNQKDGYSACRCG